MLSWGIKCYENVMLWKVSKSFPEVILLDLCISFWEKWPLIATVRCPVSAPIHPSQSTNSIHPWKVDWKEARKAWRIPKLGLEFLLFFVVQGGFILIWSLMLSLAYGGYICNATTLERDRQTDRWGKVLKIYLDENSVNILDPNVLYNICLKIECKFCALIKCYKDSF